MSKQEQIVDGEISLDNFNALFEPDNDIVEDQEEVQLEEDPIEEEQTEDPIEQEQTQEEVNDVLEDTSTSSYTKAQNLIELGYLEDVMVATSEDEEPKPLSEIKNLSEEQLQMIIENQREEKDKEREEKFISKEGLDEHQLTIVNILKNGGSLKEIFTDPDKGVKRPFSGVDLKTPKGQATVVLDKLINVSGLNQQDALKLIKGKLEDGTLEDEANQIHTDYNNMYDAELKRIEQETINKRQELQEKVKNTRAALSSRLKEAKLKEGVSKKIIDGVTKVSKEGITEVEKAFKTLLENPEENYEVLLHILDQKSFQDIYNLKKEKHTTGKVLKIFNALPKERKQQQRKSEEFLSTFEEELMDNIIKLKN